MEYNGEFNPWPDETSMPKLSAQLYPDGDFYLTAGEKKLLAQVEEVYDKIVVVLNIGGVIDLSWIKRDDKIGAALYGGQGGMEGGTAMAQVLCGLVNPSGKLADTFAARLEDYPSTENFHESVEYVDYTEDIYVGYRYFETIPGAAEKVVYPFGYGLSYTTFEVEIQKAWEEADSINVQVKVTNTGDMAGKEVVQLYVNDKVSSMVTPVKQLRDFRKVSVKAGETKTVKLKVAVNDLYMVTADNKRVVEPGEFELQVGAASDNILQMKTVTVGEFASAVTVEKQKTVKSSKIIPVHGEIRDVQATLIGKVNIHAKSTGKLLGKSDEKGCYKINAGNQEVLVFSKKGYQKLEVPVDNQEAINIRMNYGEH